MISDSEQHLICNFISSPTHPFKLSEQHSEKRVRDEFGAGQQRVEVEPLIAQAADRQPVLAVVADKRFLGSEVLRSFILKNRK